jgi:cytochrome b561
VRYAGPVDSTPPAPPRYTATAIALHWLLAAAIVASFCVGLFMVELQTSPLKLKLYNWHKWAGVTILALSLLRLAWRLTHPPPPDLPSMPPWQQRAAHAAHWLLYGLFLAVPLAGWAYSSAAGFPVVLFGVWPLPDFVPADKALAEAIKPLHWMLAYALAALVLTHVAAALKHHAVDGDGLLARMWPSRAG